MSEPRMQCRTCPWRVDADPLEIPNGYCVDMHRALATTIAEPGVPRIGGPLPMMACHYSVPGSEFPCVGWLAHQLGPGNNLALRMAVSEGLVDANVQIVGEQHERFEDTLPD